MSGQRLPPPPEVKARNKSDNCHCTQHVLQNTHTVAGGGHNKSHLGLLSNFCKKPGISRDLGQYTSFLFPPRLHAPGFLNSRLFALLFLRRRPPPPWGILWRQPERELDASSGQKRQLLALNLVRGGDLGKIDRPDVRVQRHRHETTRLLWWTNRTMMQTTMNRKSHGQVECDISM